MRSEIIKWFQTSSLDEISSLLRECKVCIQWDYSATYGGRQWILRTLAGGAAARVYEDINNRTWRVMLHSLTPPSDRMVDENFSDKEAAIEFAMSEVVKLGWIIPTSYF